MITEIPQTGGKTDAEPPQKLLDGYITEEEYARQRGVSLRTCQRDRALRQSPPYVVIGRDVYYRMDAIRDWLLKHERTGSRQPQSLARRRLP